MSFLSSFFQKRREARIARESLQCKLDVADAKARYEGATAKLAPLGARLTDPKVFCEESPVAVRGFFTLNDGDTLYSLTATPKGAYIRRV